MVYVVERYLPGLYRSDLLSGSRSSAAQGTGGREAGGALPRLDHRAGGRGLLLPVRRALRGGRRRGEPAAGLPFDRIVPAVTVNPKGAEMSVYPSIPATVEIERGRLVGLVARIAAAGGRRHLGPSRVRVRQRRPTTASSGVQASAIGNPLPPASLHFRSWGGLVPATSAAQDGRNVPSVMSLTPARSRRRARSEPATPSRPHRAARPPRRSSPR